MRRALVAAWLMAGAGPLAAQGEPTVEVASRVRIRTLDSAGRAIRWMDGTVASRSRDTLQVRAAGGESIVSYWSQPGKELWVRAETHRNVQTGAILGGVFGGLTGLIIGAATGDDCTGPVEFCFSSEQITLIATVGGIVGGMATGGLIGRYLIRPRWVRSARFSSGPTVSVRRGLGVQIAFRF
jgi:hypothetical protein